jgi:predicted LPLAT superfamily acyltransferase
LVFVSLYYAVADRRAVRASKRYFDNLRAHCGKPGQTPFQTWRHFYRFGQVLLDRVAIISGMSDRFRFTFDGEEHLRAALAEGDGLVLLTAHAGNWEAAGHMLSRLSAPVNVVAFEGEVEQIRKMFDRALEKRSFRIIAVEGALDTAIEIISALRRGEVVAMHADRSAGERFANVDFLGKAAPLPLGPHLLAAVSAAPVATAFVMREGTYEYSFKAWPAESAACERETRDEDIRRAVERYARRLEETLKKHPFQWFNFYDFWEGASVE